MLELLKEESNKTYTENGAVTYKGTDRKSTRLNSSHPK